MNESISIWKELLEFVGCKLELMKYTWYLIDWEFDEFVFPRMKTNLNKISFKDNKGDIILTQQLQQSEELKYLWVSSQINGGKQAQS